MSEINQLIKEIRVDWEDIFSEVFNPLLHLERGPSSSIFRDSYHRIEQCMEGIIDSKYQNFAKAISSYREMSSLVDECIKQLKEISEQIKTICKCLEIDVEYLDRQCREYKLLHNTNHIISSINDIRVKFHRLTQLIHQERVEEAVNIIIGIESQLTALGPLRAMSDLFSEVERLRKLVLNMLFNSVSAFIFDDVFDRSMVRCIKALSGIPELDKYLCDNTPALFYQHIEEIIQSNKSLTNMIRRVLIYTENILTNYKEVCRLLGQNEKEDANFFEVDDKKLLILGNEGFKKAKEMIYYELKRMIKTYLEVDTNKHTSFRLCNIDNSIIDDGLETKMGDYTLIVPPNIESAFIFYEHVGVVRELKKELREYLQRKLQKRYLRQRESAVKRQVLSMLKHNGKYGSFLDGFSELMKTYFSECKRVGITSKNGFLFIFEAVYSRFKKNFTDIFRSEIVLECVFKSDGELQPEPFDILKKKVLVKKIDPQSFGIKKSQIEFLIQSLVEVVDIYSKQMHEYEILEKDESVESLLTQYKILCTGYYNALRIERLVEVAYYFDLFFREGNFLLSPEIAINRIVRCINEIEEKEETTNLLNYYIRNNIKKLNAKSKCEMEGFIGQIELLDEITGGLEISVEFLKEYFSQNY
ncbi:hypothetical protein TCON_1988 [Astathelohania contejeani]|uniref:Exocyst complex component Sec8 N-terminal domain-containing protein n=1 Tax=Astathelohania contejeani TaxID=164912 RepID=A0ABQ7HX94_9MICR|nr:hypothetical protein TCON_1988 [Thelohania contejeani]